MSEPFLGMIILGGWNFAPRGYALCNGQLLSIAQNTALFSLLGTTYGGNGQTTFGLPNLQSRLAMHWGQGQGLSPVVIGEQSGVESVTLNVNQMPAHTHTFTSTSTLNAATSKATLNTPAGNMLARINDNSGGTGTPVIYLPANSTPVTPLGGLNVAGTNSIAGGSQPFSIRNPYLGVTHVIALEGIFPSRN